MFSMQLPLSRSWSGVHTTGLDYQRRSSVRSWIGKGQGPPGKNWIASHASTRHLGFYFSGHTGVRVGTDSPACRALTHIWVDYELEIAATGIPDQATANGWSRVLYWCISFPLLLGAGCIPPPRRNPSTGLSRTLPTEMPGRDALSAQWVTGSRDEGASLSGSVDSCAIAMPMDTPGTSCDERNSRDWLPRAQERNPASDGRVHR